MPKILPPKALGTLLLTGALLMAGCAPHRPDFDRGQGRADRGPPPGGRRGRDGPPGGEQAPRQASLFVSPSGEPFRAQPGEPYPVGVWFKQADLNGDGKIDQAEFVADAERFFPHLDQNHDGVIDGAEVHVYENQMVPEILLRIDLLGAAASRNPLKMLVVDRDQGGGMGGPGGGMGGGGGGRGGGSGGPGPEIRRDTPQRPRLTGAAPYNLLAEPEPVANSDLDLNGRITLTVFKRRAEQRFKALDSDLKGYLTLAGLPKTQAQTDAEAAQGRGGRRGGPDDGPGRGGFGGGDTRRPD